MERFPYELVKELKDAGFTFKSHACGHCQITESTKEYPTLEELIEACGERLHTLRSEGDSWMAGADYQGSHWSYQQHGSIPSEAVARLWLALNKK